MNLVDLVYLAAFSLPACGDYRVRTCHVMCPSSRSNATHFDPESSSFLFHPRSEKIHIHDPTAANYVASLVNDHVVESFGVNPIGQIPMTTCACLGL